MQKRVQRSDGAEMEGGENYLSFGDENTVSKHGKRELAGAFGVVVQRVGSGMRFRRCSRDFR